MQTVYLISAQHYRVLAFIDKTVIYKNDNHTKFFNKLARKSCVLFQTPIMLGDFCIEFVSLAC